MKTTSLRIFGALLVLGVLWVMVPGARADETTDYINQIYQDQKDRDDYINSVIERATALRDARWADAPPAAPVAAPVAAPPVRATPQPVPQDLFAGDSGGMALIWKPGMAEAQVNPMLTNPDVKAQAQVQPSPDAFSQMVRQNQEQVRQQIMQTQQQVMQKRQEILQQQQELLMGVQH
jgi:hypothetical protein